MTCSVLQWNVSYTEDIDRIGEVIAASGADIVCLQELTLGYQSPHADTGAYLAQQLGFYSYVKYGSSLLPDGGQTQMGNGIFSRWPLTQTQKLVLLPGVTKEDGTLVQPERSYLQVVVNTPDGPIGVGTAHLLFHPRFQTTPGKFAMVEAVSDSIAATGDGAFIFAGDLNATPRSKAAKRLRSNGLMNAGPSLDQKSWTTEPFNIGPWSYSELQWRLDYVLKRGPLRTTDAQLLSPGISDHLPLLTRMNVK